MHDLYFPSLCTDGLKVIRLQAKAQESSRVAGRYCEGLVVDGFSGRTKLVHNFEEAGKGFLMAMFVNLANKVIDFEGLAFLGTASRMNQALDEFSKEDASV